MTALANMTDNDLRRLIEEIVDERLEARLLRFPEQDINVKPSWEEARAYIESHRLTPSPGTKSALEMLREDRDH